MMLHCIVPESNNNVMLFILNSPVSPKFALPLKTLVSFTETQYQVNPAVVFADN